MADPKPGPQACTAQMPVLCQLTTDRPEISATPK